MQRSDRGEADDEQIPQGVWPRFAGFQYHHHAHVGLHYVYRHHAALEVLRNLQGFSEEIRRLLLHDERHTSYWSHVTVIKLRC